MKAIVALPHIFLSSRISSRLTKLMRSAAIRAVIARAKALLFIIAF